MPAYHVTLLADTPHLVIAAAYPPQRDDLLRWGGVLYRVVGARISCMPPDWYPLFTCRANTWEQV